MAKYSFASYPTTTISTNTYFTGATNQIIVGGWQSSTSGFIDYYHRAKCSICSREAPHLFGHNFICKTCSCIQELTELKENDI
jgi:hypothetical protein